MPNVIAALRARNDAVSVGDISDGPLETAAFHAGWDAHHAYLEARRQHRYDDSPWRMTGALMLIIGFMISVSIFLLTFTVPADALRPGWWLSGVVGGVIMLIGLPIYMKGHRDNAAKQKAFDARWHDV